MNREGTTNIYPSEADSREMAKKLDRMARMGEPSAIAGMLLLRWLGAMPTPGSKRQGIETLSEIAETLCGIRQVLERDASRERIRAAS